jgi:branched-chain amino acid transport system substrate-binding protein
LNGILVAVDRINRSGGVEGRKIDLVVTDNRSEADATVRAVSHLDDEDVVAIVGPLASGNALAAAREVQERCIPVVLPSATLMGVTGTSEYVSRVCFTNEFQARVMAHFAWDFLRARSFALATEMESRYSKELAHFFVEEVRKLGGEVLWTGEYRGEQKRFDEIVATLTTIPADAVFLPGYYGEVVPFLRQVKEVDLGIPILGGDGWDVPLLVDAPSGCASGNYFVAHFAAAERRDVVTEFVDLYEDKHDQPPHSLAALGYDAVWLVTDALSRAPETEREDVKNAINSTRGFRGLTGTLSLNADRDGIKSAVIMKVAEEGLHFIDRISPRRIAHSDAAGPARPSDVLSP